MYLLESALFVASLLALNAAYVVAELGALGVRTTRLRELAGEGNALAGRLLPLLDGPAALERWVSACQIGITISTLALGAYGDARLGPAVGALLRAMGAGPAAASAASTALVLGALTLLQMVVAELVPKSLALRYPTAAVLSMTLPMAWSLRAYSGLLRVFGGATRLVLRAAGVSERATRAAHSPEELAYLIGESARGGLLPADARRRLEAALGLERLEARELMVPRAQVRALDVEAEGDELLRALDGPYTRLPVYRRRFDDVLGVLHTRDVARERLRTGRAPDVSALLRPAVVVRPEDRADRVLAALREGRAELAVVVGAAGLVVGLLTLEDVLAAVFGELADDLEPPRAPPVRGERSRRGARRAGEERAR